MTREMKENLAIAIQHREEIIGNRQNYTLVRPTYVLVADKECEFKLVEVLGHHNPDWTCNVFWKQHRYGVHIKNDPETQASIRQAIAEKVPLPVDEIDPELHINARGNGEPCHNIQPEHFAWGSYTVGYKQRKLEDKPFFDQAKYDSDLDAIEQNISAITDAIELAGGVGGTDLI